MVFEVERRDYTNAKAALKVITIPASASEVSSFREDNFDLDERSVTSYFYGFVEEFTKEFALMSRLKGNSNIVSIEDYDVKEHGGEIGWDIFIRMELLTPLNRQFAKEAPTTEDIIRLGIDICKALEVCQQYQIVHRDIKPNNIFVSETGMFKLGDFGVARTLEKTSGGLSKKGTYTYMAPEVYKGEAYGASVDLYSLGIVMYKLLNNNMEPFRTARTHTDEENALVKRLRGDEMPKPANADGRLAEIVLKACSFLSGDRYESPQQMREALESLLLEKKEGIKSAFDGGAASFEEDDEETSGIFGNRPVRSEQEARKANSKAPEATKETVGESAKETVKETEADFDGEDETVGIFGSRKEQESRKRREAEDYWTGKIREAGEIAEENKRKEEAAQKEAAQKETAQKETAQKEAATQKQPTSEQKSNAAKAEKKKRPAKKMGIFLACLIGVPIFLLVGLLVFDKVGTMLYENKQLKLSEEAPLVDYAGFLAAAEESYVRVEGYVADFCVTDGNYVDLILQNPGEKGAIYIGYRMDGYIDVKYGQKIAAAGEKLTDIYLSAKKLEILPDAPLVYNSFIDNVNQKIGTSEMKQHDGEVVAVTGRTSLIDVTYDSSNVPEYLSFRVQTKDGKTVECQVYDYIEYYNHLTLKTRMVFLPEMKDIVESHGHSDLTIYGVLSYYNAEESVLSVTGYNIP